MNKKKVAGTIFCFVLALLLVGMIAGFAWLYIDLGNPDPEGGWRGPDDPPTADTPPTIYWSPLPSSSP